MSNARLDLPEPDSPVNTMSLSRGSSTSTFSQIVLASALNDETISHGGTLAAERRPNACSAVNQSVADRNLRRQPEIDTLKKRDGLIGAYLPAEKGANIVVTERLHKTKFPSSEFEQDLRSFAPVGVVG